ncbi:MAG: AAA family ATPase, partial [Bacteroidetes bacterium]|nr:AAA family ATPase [Bacteroidota bacterium]
PNVTAIIGKNGTGKTCLLDFLTDALGTTPWYSFEDYVALFFDEKTKGFFVRHNLFENRYLENYPFIQPMRGAPRINVTLELPAGYQQLQNGAKSKTHQIIYYSPILDLRNYPVQTEEKSFIDVSTDFLLITDTRLQGANERQVETHRFKNVERQLNFVLEFQKHKEVSSKFKLPIGMEVVSLELEDKSDWFSNLSSSAKEIREFFLGGNIPEERGLIRSEIDKKNSELYSLEEVEETRTDKYRQVQLDRIGFFFLREFAYHFFWALNSEADWLNLDIVVTTEALQNKTPWEAFRYFLEHQTWRRDGDNQAAVKLLDILEQTLNLDKVKIASSHRDHSVFIKKIKDAHVLLNAHFAYLQSLPIWRKSGSVKDYLHFNWHNLSSGEKAFLDVFSRLYYAYAIVKERDWDQYSKKTTHTKWICLLLDEGEVGFHPDWQREYLRLLLDMIPHIFKGIKVQVILTSHSPFVISDLPKGNVIFLKKKDEEPTRIDSGVGHEKTFAANIHTLLSDSFFMEKGLIGAFAQEKIKNALKDIKNKKEEKKESIRRLIALIGEPVISSKMEQFFFEKFGHSVNEKNLDERIAILKRELSEAENQKNNA